MADEAAETGVLRPTEATELPSNPTRRARSTAFPASPARVPLVVPPAQATTPATTRSWPATPATCRRARRSASTDRMDLRVDRRPESRGVLPQRARSRAVIGLAA